MTKKSCLLVLMAITSQANVFAADIRLVTEGAYAPWNYIDDSGEIAGFEIDLGNELCDRMAASCEWVTNDWDSIIPNLIAGNYDAIMAGMSATEERRQTIEFSADYFPPEPARYIALKNANVHFDDLKGLKFGAQGATIHSAYLEETFQEDNSILKYETPDQSIADLVAGNIDLLFADGLYLEPIVNESDGALEFVGPEQDVADGVGIGMRKSDTELHEKIKVALESVKADGTLDNLIMEYFKKGPYFQ